MIDDAVVLERPKVMKLLLAHIFMWRQTENTIGLRSQSLRLVKSQELEESALVIFQLHFHFDSASSSCIKRLDACIVFPNEALKFC